MTLHYKNIYVKKQTLVQRFILPSTLGMTTLFLFLCLSFNSNAEKLGQLKLHSAHLKVSDIDRSISFYQNILGLSLIGQNGNTRYLRLGNGPQHLALSPTSGSQSPHIANIGLSSANFDITEFSDLLKEKGLKQIDQKDSTNKPPLALASSFWIDQSAIIFVDQEGVQFQLSDTHFCGNNVKVNCQIENNASGLLKLKEINHFTTFTANAGRANSFYRELLSLDIQSYQGPTTPALAVGDGLQFLMFVGGAQSGPPKNPARIHHISMSVEDFSVDGIFDKLKANGFKARESGNNATPPFIYYVSKRMPNRGGAEGGTPEVYFTDPDGILLQVQDPSYCGGDGYLGDKC